MELDVVTAVVVECEPRCDPLPSLMRRVISQKSSLRHLVGEAFPQSTTQRTGQIVRKRTSDRVMPLIVLFLAGILLSGIRDLKAADLSGAAVKESIERGCKFLISQQAAGGHWEIGSDGDRVGVTSLAVMALLNSGMSPQDERVKRGLNYLRSIPREPGALGNHETYQISLVIMALVAAKENSVDAVRIAQLAQRLEAGQNKGGDAAGGWGYGLNNGNGAGGDPSNSQFAVLGLREAVDAGASVSPETWERARKYWERAQNGDGGWGYGNTQNTSASKGSMTVAGISSLVICEQMLRTDDGVAPDGTPPCCQGTEPNLPLEKGIAWLSKNFAVGHNPGGENGWLLYYIYGVERAGRLSGLRFFGDHDWYREGAAYLVAMQNRVSGFWQGNGSFEGHPIVGTSMALLFLSKGLAPVLINKLKYGPRNPQRKFEVPGNDWNRHRRDVRNLVDMVSGLPKWPKLLTTQDLDLARAVESGGVNSLLQAPVLFMTGEEAPKLSPAEIKLLKDYLQEGGFIFAAPTCTSTKFEAGFRALVEQIMPPGEGELKRLTAEHPVFRSEYPLQAEASPLFGVDFGCRTSIMYSPEDLGCLWDYWSRVDPPKRNVNLKGRIIRATQIGVNVLAYATGREPPAKSDIPQVVKENTDFDNIERGLLQIAQIRHDGSWNAAPRALRRLLLALNDTAAMSASTKANELAFADADIFQYPIIYMHGRNKFSATEADRQQLRKYLKRGGVLFADSCCGAKPFDKGFREFVAALFPDEKLERIPVDHELFSQKHGRDIRKLKRRMSEGAEGGNALGFVVRDAEPFLEGLVVDGRLAIIYSKYDISCALERQAAGNCEGYLPEEAVKLAINVILYSMMEDVRLATPDKDRN